MIPMSDSDVQDVRDLVATQAAEYATNLQVLARVGLSRQPLTDEEVPILLQAARQEKDRIERERRLGLEPGQVLGTDASISAHPQPGPRANNASGSS
jgi:hypothetical protein